MGRIGSGEWRKTPTPHSPLPTPRSFTHLAWDGDGDGELGSPEQARGVKGMDPSDGRLFVWA